MQASHIVPSEQMSQCIIQEEQTLPFCQYVMTQLVHIADDVQVRHSVLQF